MTLNRLLLCAPCLAVITFSPLAAEVAANEQGAALIERSGCLGSCPSYEVEIHASGRIVWHGNDYVAVKGTAESTIDASEVEQMFAKYFPRADREICIEEEGIDAPIYYVLYSKSGNLGEVKSQRDEYFKLRQRDPTIADPCSLKEAIAALTEMERLTNVHQWLHGKESIQDSEKVSGDIFYGIKRGFTPLMREAGKGNLEGVKALAVNNSVDAVDESGWTALMVAASQCRLEVVKFLLSLGANPNAIDSDGDSPLMAAATAYCHRFDTDEQSSTRQALIRTLLTAGAKANAANRKGQTPLMVAAKFGNYDAVNALLQRHAQVSATDKSGMDAKAYATKYQHQVHRYNSDSQKEYRERFNKVISLLTAAQRQSVHAQ